MSSLKVVKASAGSGKTYMLTAQYIASAMASPRAFRTILAVTFTNKATAEMKSRILEKLSELSQERGCEFAKEIQKITGYSFEEIESRAAVTLGAILGDYSAFSVSTIDKFFQRIVRSFFRELGLDINYELILDEKESVSEAIDKLIERSVSNSSLEKKLSRLVASRIEEGKRVNIHRELSELLGKAIGADFFSGSAVSISEIEELYEDLTSRVKAFEKELFGECDKACRLIEECGVVELSDFKYKGTSFAAYFFKIQRLREVVAPGARFLDASDDNDYSDVSEESKAQQWGDKVLVKNCTNSELKSRLRELMACTKRVMDLYNENLELLNTLKAISQNFAQYILLRELGEELDRVNSLKGQLSISSTTSLIRRVAEEASVSFIFEKLGSRYLTIFIDEFQDTSRSQWDGFLPLIIEAVSKSESSAASMLIGDVKQAIYRWRGGDWRLLASGIVSGGELGDVSQMTLDTSWRSDRQIVEFNNELFTQLKSVGSSVINAFIEDTSKSLLEKERAAELDVAISQMRGFLGEGYADVKQNLPESKKDSQKGYVEMVCIDDKAERLEWMADVVEDLKERYRACDIAILVRFNGEGELVAGCLSRRGIAFMSDDALSLGSSSLVCFVVEVMRFALSGSSAISRYAVEDYLGKELSEEDIVELRRLSMGGALDFVEGVVSLFDLGGRDVYYLQSLCNLAYVYDCGVEVGIGGFVQGWESSYSSQRVVLPESRDAVKILSIHKSKGLEYEAVVMPMVNWRIYPKVRGLTSGTTLWSVAPQGSDFEEFGVYPLDYSEQLRESAYRADHLMEGVSSIVDNINLLYVALTRACTEMYLCVDMKVNAKKARSVSDLVWGACGKAVVFDRGLDELKGGVVAEGVGGQDRYAAVRLSRGAKSTANEGAKNSNKEAKEQESIRVEHEPLVISKLMVYTAPVLDVENSNG